MIKSILRILQNKHDKEIPEPDNLPSGCIYCKQYNGRGCNLTGIQFWSEMNVAVRPKGCPLVSAKQKKGGLNNAYYSTNYFTKWIEL